MGWGGKPWRGEGKPYLAREALLPRRTPINSDGVAAQKHWHCLPRFAHRVRLDQQINRSTFPSPSVTTLSKKLPVESKHFSSLRSPKRLREHCKLVARNQNGKTSGKKHPKKINFRAKLSKPCGKTESSTKTAPCPSNTNDPTSKGGAGLRPAHPEPAAPRKKPTHSMKNCGASSAACSVETLSTHGQAGLPVPRAPCCERGGLSS